MLCALATLALLQVGGSGPPLDAVVTQFGREERIDALLDLDGDGDLDAAGWWWGSDYQSSAHLNLYQDPWGSAPAKPTISTFVSLPNGGFESVSNPYLSFSSVADFNGDGRDDLAFSTHTDFSVYLAADQAPFPVWMVRVLWEQLATKITALDTGDFDGDGDVDIAILRVQLSTLPGELRVYWNNGVGQFTAGPSQLYSAAVGDLVAGEFNPLPGTELALASPLAVAILKPSALVYTTLFSAATSASAPMASAGDLDGDQDEDVVLFQMGGTYQLLRQTSAGAFQVEAPAVGGPATDLADVNGDGVLDGVCCGGGGPSDEVNTNASQFEIALNDGSGGFAPAFQIPSLGAHHIAGAADLDQDGDTDLVGGRCVYYANGPISASPYRSLGLPPGEHPLVSESVFDAEDDGDPDLLPGIGVWRRNLADGSFAPASSLPPPIPGTYWGGPGFPGDFDGDGDQDLLASLRFNNEVVNSMRFLENRGGVWFDAHPAGDYQVDFNVPSGPLFQPVWIELDQPQHSITADLDGDGDLDLITNKTGEYGSHKRWLNDGAGFFTLSVYDIGYAVAAARDFTGDGVVDLLLWRNSGLGLSTGQGAGTFGPQVVILGSVDLVKNQDRLAVADLDQDGDLDLALLGNWSNDHGVAWNDGVGHFTLDRFQNSIPNLDFWYSSSSSSLYPKRVFALQLDDDEQLELAAGPAFFKNDVSGNPDQRRSFALIDVLPGGGFELLSMQLVDPTAVADLDGDGDEELLRAEQVENWTWHGPTAGLREQYGAGPAGTDGIAPIMGVGGSVRANQWASFRLRGALGGTPLLLGFSTEIPALPVELLPGLYQYVGLGGLAIVPLTANGTPGLGGDGGWDFMFYVSPFLAGLSVVHQIFVVDPAAPFGLTATNALHVVYG